MTPERKAELETLIAKAHDVGNQFYWAMFGRAIGAEWHPLIEFSGLFNEYIKVCQRALAQGVDFTQCSAHTGNPLPIKGYELAYLNEKIECIFSGQFKLVPNEEKVS